MIELIERNGIVFQVDIESPFRRYKPGKPKSVIPPVLPPAVRTLQEITEQAQGVDESAGRRLRKKTGRRTTRIARPELAGVPANIARTGLKTKLGAAA